MSLLAVIILAVAALVVLRRMSYQSRLRIAVMHSLSVLADSQSAHRRRYGRWASAIGPRPGPDTITIALDSGAAVGILRADSTGWEGVGSHPLIQGGARLCMIFGGLPRDSRLTRENEPRCF